MRKTAAKAPRAAARLIASVRKPEVLPAHVRKALQELLEHNDAHQHYHRVTADAAIQMLRDMGLSMGRCKFDKVIRREFGRAWGSK